jgi:hypothetical protein
MCQNRFRNQKRTLLFTVIALLACMPHAHLRGQESILYAYQQNFIRASLDAKPEILLDAATDERAHEFMGQLYDYALDFVLHNVEFIGTDPQMTYLAIIAVRGAGVTEYQNSADTLWNVFQKYHDSTVRTEILGTLSILGKTNREIVSYINQYLLEQNRLRFSRLENTDFHVISACIAALAEFGDASSFLSLFGAMTADYSPSITADATEALDALPGDLRQFLLELIIYNPPAEKLAAFKFAVNNARFSQVQQGQLAQNAMEQGLTCQAADTEEASALSSLRYEAALELTRLQWSLANQLVIRHFYRVQSDYLSATVPKERYLEAIYCLGAMGTSEAAVQAALQLGLNNSQTEITGYYDEAITFALINVIGLIGDKSASDPVLAVDYLPYSDEIKAAAKEALDRLRW